MAWMITPNGVQVNASAHDVPLFEKHGYKHVTVDEQPQAPAKRTRKRTTKAVENEG